MTPNHARYDRFQSFEGTGPYAKCGETNKVCDVKST
jgi:hypothetical protein